MEQGLIPRRYAKALLEVARQRGCSDEIYKLMLRINNAFAATEGLSQTVANPFVSDADKTALLTTAAGEGAAECPTFTDFLKLLEQNRRTSLTRSVALAYIALYREENHIYHVEIVSAATMGDDERARLQKLVENHIGNGSFDFSYSVDPALIGGFTVTVNSERLDASVRSKLEHMRLMLVD